MSIAAGVYDDAIVFSDSGLGVFFSQFSENDQGLVLYNEKRSVLSDVDVLTAISLGLNLDPEMMQIRSGPLSFQEQS